MPTSSTLLGKTNDDARRRTRRTRLFLILGGLVLLALAVIGILTRWSAHETLKQRTQAESIPTVSVMNPTSAARTDDIRLPATVQAFVDAPIYARTDGYVKSWFYDIGTRVKKGDLLAVIETPELDQQLEQARAAVGTAKANYDLSIVTNNRYQALVKTAAVSRQEADQSASNQASQRAQLDAAVANVHHYEALQSFEKLYAPFDGIVTERNTDVGQLVTSGTGSGGGTGTGASGRELFRVGAVDKLRTFIPVPQAQAVYIRSGQPADLSFIEYPGRTFPGHVARTSNSIDVASRTLLTEVDIDNAQGQLKPGSYVTVHIAIPSTATSGAVRVPANTLIFRSEGMQLGVVGQDNKVQLRKADIGRDFGTEVEIVSGVTPDDRVVVNPPDSLADGQQVNIAEPPKAVATEAQGGHGPEKEKHGNQTDGGSTGNNGGKKQQQDIKPSPGSGGVEEKVSRKPDTGNNPSGKTGGNSGSSDSGGGNGQAGSGKGTKEPGGMTAPGSDGNGAK